MSLASVGVTGFEEEVYRALLRGRVVDGEPDVVRVAIVRLVKLELVQLDEEGRAIAVEPEVGLARLIRRRMQEANAELRRICGAWEALHTLTSEGDSHRDIVRIEDADEADELIWALSLDAGEVLAMYQKRRVRAEVLPGPLRSPGEGARWRTIIAWDHLKDAEMIEYCTRLHRGGERHRITDGVVQQVIMLDRVVAFVPTVPGGHRSGALMIRQPGVVATLVDLFERVWEHATDLEADASPRITPRERQILCLLTTVAKDEIAAREMDMSLRTYRRHVADLLARLGTVNRVQAAVLAKEKGWI